MTYADYDGYSNIEQEEIVSVGMEAVFEAIRKIDMSKVKDEDAWVYMVVRRKQQNFFNLAQNRPCLHLEGPNPADRDVTLAEAIEGSHTEDTHMDLKQAIRNLPSKERVIVVLRYWLGWQLDDIGKLMKCSKVNVHYHEKKALTKLSQILLQSGR